MATTDIRNILYKSIEQEVSSGTNFKLFSVDNTNAYTIRVYIDSSGNKFSFEVNNDSDGTNYKIENYAINQNITIYKNKSSDSDIYYVKFANNTAFTIRKEIIYGYLTDANTVGTAVSGTPIATLTTSSPKHIFAGNSAFIGNSTVTGDVDFNGGFTAEKDVNLTGNINFHNFYIDDFINTPGTVPDGASKITFKDSDETLDIYGIYNEILQPIKVDNSVYQGKITILVSISNATLSESTQGAAELTLLELVGTSQPEQKYQVVYIQSSSSIEIRSIKSNNKEVLSTIMIGGNYIINTVTIPFANNISCKVTNVYLKEEGSAITIYKVADKIIGGGESDSDASHYLLTAQSLSQILTLSSLSAGATTTNLTKNPDSTFNYDDGKNYLLYQTGSNTTNVYNTNETGKRFIFIENDKVQDKEGTVINKADTVLLRGTNGDINVGNIVSSGYVESNGDFYTKTTDTYSLGKSGKYFVNGYIRNIYSTKIATSDITATTANLTTITGKFDKKFIVKGANTIVASYNGSADDEFNVVAGTNILVSGNATNGTITIGHQQHNEIASEARWDENHNNLYIRNVKTDISGHVTSYPEQQVDLSAHYLRCDADDEKSGSTKFTGNVNINSASNSENANSGKIIFSDTSSDTISIFKSDITETGHSLCTKIFDNGITATYKFSFKNFGNNATYEYTMPNKAGQIMLTNDNYAGSTSPGGSANSVANSFTYGVSAGSATSTSYNGGDAKTLYIVGSNGLSTSFSGSNTVTISHPTYTGHTQTAAWGSGGDAHKLFIPKIKSNSYGHIESTTENELIDLSTHYLRCDADDSIDGSLTSNNAFILSSSFGAENGIFVGNGDTSTLERYNWKLSSWYGIGIYCSATGRNKATGVIDTRTGSITMTGTITANKLVGTLDSANITTSQSNNANITTDGTGTIKITINGKSVVFKQDELSGALEIYTE